MFDHNITGSNYKALVTMAFYLVIVFLGVCVPPMQRLWLKKTATSKEISRNQRRSRRQVKNVICNSWLFESCHIVRLDSMFFSEYILKFDVIIGDSPICKILCAVCFFVLSWFTCESEEILRDVSIVRLTLSQFSKTHSIFYYYPLDVALKFVAVFP